MPQKAVDTVSRIGDGSMQRYTAKLKPVSAAIATAFALLSYGPCFALSIGNAVSHGHIGGPLRIEAPLQIGETEKFDSACVRIAPKPADYSDDIPWLTSGKIRIEQRAGGPVVVITAPATNEPAVRIGIQSVCDVQLRRDFTLLLDAPSETDNVQSDRTSGGRSLTAAPDGVARHGSVPNGRPAESHNSEWITAPGETPMTIAQSLIRAGTSAQRRFAQAILRGNVGRPGVPHSIDAPFEAGTAIIVPLVDASPTPSASESRPQKAAEPQRRDPSVGLSAPTREKKTKDHLVVQGLGDGTLQLATSIGQRKELSERERQQLKEELQLIAILDDKIARQIELSERIRQLEGVQQRLQANADRLEAQLRTQAQHLSTLSGTQTTPPPVTAQVEAVSAAKTTQHSWTDAVTSTPFVISAATLLSSLLGALWWRRRAEPATEESHEPNFKMEISPSSEEDRQIDFAAPLTEADIWPEAEHTPSPASAAAMQGALGPLSIDPQGPLSVLQLGDDEKEHDSAVELAEIMMSFGRVKGAAQTLADFIRSKPRQAVEPWIKLLEVYRAADMRVEFDALTSQLNKTFNVRPPSWDGFEVAATEPESLEGYPHILQTLLDTWGKRDCHTYLHTLLRDNRQGTRQGFPLAVVDEILLLLSILESVLPAANEASSTKENVAVTHAGDFPPISVGEHSPPDGAVPPVASTPLAALDDPFESTFSPAMESNHTPVYEQREPEVNAGQTTSYVALDFNLDAADLERSLHINLDDLNEFDFDSVAASSTSVVTSQTEAKPHTGLSISTKSV